MNRFMIVGRDAGLANLTMLDHEPAGWAGASGMQREEVLQTLLRYHLSELAGEPLDVLFRASDYWGAPDLVAVDAQGRLHIFELKKQKIGTPVLAQLAGYVRSACEKLDDWEKHTRNHEADHTRMALYLAGAWADESTYSLQGEIIAAAGQFDDDRRALWRSKARRQEFWRKNSALWCTEAAEALMHVAAQLRGVERAQLPTLADLLGQGEQWRARILRALDQGHSRVLGGGPHVVWAAGPEFTSDIKRAVRNASHPIVGDWLAGGLEVRLLEAEVRADAANGWLVRTRQVGRNSAQPGIQDTLTSVSITG